MTPLEKKLYEALKGFISIRHRIDGCGDPNCLVCTENSKVLKDAQDAVRDFETKYEIDDIPF